LNAFFVSPMEQMPCWEANSHSPVQEIPRHICNPKVHYYRVHKGSLLVPVLSQVHPVHNFPPYFPKIHSNIVFLSTATSSEWSLPFRFSGDNCVCTCHLPMRATFPPISSSSCSLLQPLATSSLLGPNILRYVQELSSQYVWYRKCPSFLCRWRVVG
jgi:hypothetical protein